MEKTFLSQPQFYQLCEAMKEERSRILSERPSRKELALQMQAKLNFRVPRTSVGTALEALGLSYTSKKVVTQTTSLKNAVPALTRAIARLYNVLGEDMPDSIKNLLEKIAK